MTEPALTWVVVHTAARAESFAAHELRRRGYEVIWLYRMGIAKHANRVDHVRKSLFPRYLFVGVLPQQSLFWVNSAHGVSTVLHQGDRLLELTSVDVARLRAWGDENGCVGYEPAAEPERERYCRGQPLQVTDGPFAGYDATVVVDNGRTICVTIAIFGRAVKIWMEPDALSFNPDCGTMAQAARSTERVFS